MKVGRIHFAGEPDTFRRMWALFTSTPVRRPWWQWRNRPMPTNRPDPDTGISPDMIRRAIVGMRAERVRYGIDPVTGTFPDPPTAADFVAKLRALVLYIEVLCDLPDELEQARQCDGHHIDALLASFERRGRVP